MPSVKLQAVCEDFSDLEVGPDRRLYLLSDKSQSIARIGELVVGDDIARADEVWVLPALEGKPEGLALTRNGRAMVALDTKTAKENLVLLEPPIAEAARRDGLDGDDEAGDEPPVHHATRPAAPAGRDA